MHFKRVDNALQRIDNGSQRICNVIQSIVKTLTMFNKCLRMDEKRVGNFFQRLIQILHKTLKTKDNVSPRCNKLNILSTQAIAVYLPTTNSIEHQNSASERI